MTETASEQVAATNGDPPQPVFGIEKPPDLNVMVPREIVNQTVSTLLSMPGYAGYLLLKEWEPYAPELFTRGTP